MNVENNKPKWTIKQAICGKTSIWLILGLVLCNLLMGFLSKIFDVPTYDLDGQMTIMLVSIIPSLVLAAPLLWVVCNLVFPLQTGELEYLNERKTRFMWSSTWSLVVGCFMLLAYPVIIVLPIAFIPPIQKAVENAANNQSMLTVIAGIAFIVSWIFIPIRVSKLINKKMMRKTHPNSEVIEEIWDGYHSELIPDKYYNNEDLDGIALILASGRTRSVKTAVRLYSLKLKCKNVLGWVVPLIGIGVAAYVVADYQQTKRDYEIDQLGRSVAKHTNGRVIIRK